MTRPKILLFDQDDCVRDTIQRSLEAVRIEVRPVAKVSDALEVLLKEDVDGMVIDLQMQSEEGGPLFDDGDTALSIERCSRCGQRFAKRRTS